METDLFPGSSSRLALMTCKNLEEFNKFLSENASADNLLAQVIPLVLLTPFYVGRHGGHWRL
jgi:hypothetical protein